MHLFTLTLNAQLTQFLVDDFQCPNNSILHQQFFNV